MTEIGKQLLNFSYIMIYIILYNNMTDLLYI